MKNMEKKPAIFDSDSGRFFQLEGEGALVADSLAMQEVLHFAREAAAEDSPCLLVGERGTGRELVAKKIHALSSRKEFSFVSIDCSRFSPQELEREIFGGEEDIARGVPGHTGLIELCSGGSIFLHNIECAGSGLQSRIHSLFEEGVYLRVGGTTPLSPDVRILASSSPRIKEKVRNGLFQEKLFYVLKRKNIVLPCLQDRTRDMESLALQFLNFGGASKRLSPCALEVLEAYSWPGNVGELRHVMEMAGTLCLSDVVTNKDIPSTVLGGSREAGRERDQRNFSFQKISLEKLERLHICAALENFGGNRTRTARFLGITPKTLYNKLHNYGYYDKKCL